MVYKRGKRGVWYYSFMIRGVKYFGSIPEAGNKEEAKAVEATKRREVYEGRYGKEPGTEDFAKFVDEKFLPESIEKVSYDHDEFRCETLKQFFTGMKFKDISSSQVERFILTRLRSKTKRDSRRSPTTVYKEFQVLYSICNMAEAAGVINTNPCRKIREKVRKKMRAWNKRTRYLTIEELPKLMNALTDGRDHIRPVVTLALLTGMRKGAIFGLEWEHINFSSAPVFVEVENEVYEVAPNRLLVAKNKLGKPYTIPMSQEVRSLLEALKLDVTNTELVFKSIRTGLKITDVKRAFKSACEEAKIKNLTFHDLRHSFSTWAAKCGAGEHVRRDLLGHSASSMTGSYTHSTPEEQQKAVNAVGKYFQRNSKTLQQVYSKSA